MKNQPLLNLPVTTLERLMDAAALLFAGGAMLLAFSQFSDLPEQIPTHFNIQGKVDGTGSKSSIFILPVIALLMAVGLIFLTKFPHKFNYPGKITAENAAFEYQRSRYLLRIVNVLTSLMFLLLTVAIIQSALGYSTGLNGLFWVVLLAILIAPVALFVFWKKPKS